ncbi:MAG TPA: CAP domain-containing protein [Ramlibacter sp.]|nr:CAP domain-containing protein [Ramlibacter sp.]
MQTKLFSQGTRIRLSLAALALLAGCATAAPQRTAANCNVPTAEVLQRVNAARAAGARCGGKVAQPARPLRWDDRLYSAAAAHSADMARRNYIEHRSPDGTEVMQRVDASAYPWKSVGENLAAGDLTLDGAVQGWIGSPAHCENMMDPKFVDVAVACVSRPGTDLGTYWTMILARK